MASSMSQSADAEKTRILKQFFRDFLSLLQERREMFGKRIVYTVGSDGYLFHKIFMILV